MTQENLEKTETATEKTSADVQSRSIWSGAITIGLVNVPVKLYAMIYDKGIAFHFLDLDIRILGIYLPFNKITQVVRHIDVKLNLAFLGHNLKRDQILDGGVP